METRRLTGVGSTASITNYSGYDSLGRVLSSQQITGGAPPYIFTYQYLLGGQLSYEKYPSGRDFIYEYNNTGQPKSLAKGTVAGACTNGNCYASGLTYAAHGAMKAATFGSLPQTLSYNSQLQLTKITAGTLWWLTNTYSATQNNGNITDQEVNATGAHGVDVTAHFQYDTLNRLSSITEGGAGTVLQTYEYDSVGNRWFDQSHTNFRASQTLAPVSPAWYDGFTNRIVGQGVTFQYDSGNNSVGPGNLTGMGIYTMTYDAEGRLKSAANGSSTTQYTYDGDGRRVQKQVGTGTPTTFVYDAGGELAAEYGGAGAGTSTQYLVTDHLGTPRLIVDGTGAVLALHDYTPFGEEIMATIAGRTGPYGGPDGVDLQFTGKERDGELSSSSLPDGLDYFGARYMSPAQGRFTSPDPVNAGAHLVNPQSWNAYAYVNNRPLSLVDPNGFEPVKAQAGTIHGFVGNMNGTTHKVGLATGAAAGNALISLGETKNFGPANTGVFNMSADRYIYTANGGWVDMVHFVFYAGRAYKYKLAGKANPVGTAVQDGYWQEWADQIRDSWSAYSYEDLPSDLLGAEFGAQFFDPTSSLSLGQQVEVFMSYLFPMAPTSAPNYAQLPQRDSKNPPIARNRTTNLMFTYQWDWLMLATMQRELTPVVTSTVTFK